jgi:hypothetical protein
MTTRNQIGFAVGLLAAAGAFARVKRMSRRLDFAGRSVLITGGSRGLGLLVARQLAGEGASLTIAARDRSELDVARTELETSGADVSSVVCDIGVPSEAPRSHPSRRGSYRAHRRAHQQRRHHNGGSG